MIYYRLLPEVLEPDEAADGSDATDVALDDEADILIFFR